MQTIKNIDTVNEDYRSRPELAAYYADRKLMWRNVILIGISNLGWGLAATVTVPLITLKLLELGVKENIQATIGSINGWALSFLVMWFSWMSDHTCSRLGRRKPYLFMSAPFIIIPMVIFPFFSESKWVWFLIHRWQMQRVAATPSDGDIDLEPVPETVSETI